LQAAKVLLRNLAGAKAPVAHGRDSKRGEYALQKGVALLHGVLFAGTQLQAQASALIAQVGGNRGVYTHILVPCPGTCRHGSFDMKRFNNFNKMSSPNRLSSTIGSAFYT